MMRVFVYDRADYSVRDRLRNTPASAPPARVAMRYIHKYQIEMLPSSRSTRIGPVATAGLNTPPVMPHTHMMPMKTVRPIASPR